MTRLFGTDGIRGVANRELTPELALAVGRAVGGLLQGAGPVLLGRDTRLSGPMLEAALVAGLCSAGADVELGGILPTPAVAALARLRAHRAGVALSASHNPIEDNGIKVFGPDGFKLPDEVETRLEAALGDADLPRPTGTGVGTARGRPEAEDDYLAYLLGLGLRPPAGLRVVVDCAYGAAWRIAPRLWEALRAQVVALHAEPDGTRINVGCGSTAPEVLQAEVRRHGADVGFAHDGDADRLIAVDERGEVVDGDRTMAIAADFLLETGRLRSRTVVATVMSNLGLERYLRARGVRLERTRVGDRYVLERLRELGGVLGGEQSGHVIFLDVATTGDGLVTALHLVHIMARSGRRLSELAAGLERFPQVLLNVPVRDREAWTRDPHVQAAILGAEQRLRGRGRLLVRASGTEPLVRVMVEAEEAQEAQALAAELAAVIARRCGAERAPLAAEEGGG